MNWEQFVEDFATLDDAEFDDEAGLDDEFAEADEEDEMDAEVVKRQKGRKPVKRSKRQKRIAGDLRVQSMKGTIRTPNGEAQIALPGRIIPPAEFRKAVDTRCSWTTRRMPLVSSSLSMQQRQDMARLTAMVARMEKKHSRGAEPRHDWGLSRCCDTGYWTGLVRRMRSSKTLKEGKNMEEAGNIVVNEKAVEELTQRIANLEGMLEQNRGLVTTNGSTRGTREEPSQVSDPARKNRQTGWRVSAAQAATVVLASPELGLAKLIGFAPAVLSLLDPDPDRETPTLNLEQALLPAAIFGVRSSFRAYLTRTQGSRASCPGASAMDPMLEEILATAPPDAEVEAIALLVAGRELPLPARAVARFKDIVTCRVPAGAVVELRQHPWVLSLKASRVYECMHAVTTRSGPALSRCSACGAGLQVRAGAASWRASTGGATCAPQLPYRERRDPTSGALGPERPGAGRLKPLWLWHDSHTRGDQLALESPDPYATLGYTLAEQASLPRDVCDGYRCGQRTAPWHHPRIGTVCRPGVRRPGGGEHPAARGSQ